MMISNMTSILRQQLPVLEKSVFFQTVSIARAKQIDSLHIDVAFSLTYIYVLYLEYCFVHEQLAGTYLINVEYVRRLTRHHLRRQH